MSPIAAALRRIKSDFSAVLAAHLAEKGVFMSQDDVDGEIAAFAAEADRFFQHQKNSTQLSETILKDLLKISLEAREASDRVVLASLTSTIRTKGLPNLLPAIDRGAVKTETQLRAACDKFTQSCRDRQIPRPSEHVWNVVLGIIETEVFAVGLQRIKENARAETAGGAIGRHPEVTPPNPEVVPAGREATPAARLAEIVAQRMASASADPVPPLTATPASMIALEPTTTAFSEKLKIAATQAGSKAGSDYSSPPLHLQTSNLAPNISSGHDRTGEYITPHLQ
ncbi:hypothetical protein HK101_001669 [Irineochytrium annulatum]|nr:hypothetical protein HK101_001669 [Irineochytrium annulatum]